MITRLHILTGFLLLFAVGCVAQPKIKVMPDSVFDFGDFYKGQRAQKKLTIKNVGSDTLRITDVHAQCGCTATMMSDQTLAPNQEGELSIDFDTHSYTGKVTKQVYIVSNDPSSPKTTIQFTTNVIPVLKFTPDDWVSFDTAKVGEKYTKTITISNPSQKLPIKILSVKGDTIVTATIQKMQLMPGEQTELQVTFYVAKAGEYSGVIELVTDHPQIPRFNVRYNSWVK